MAELLVYIRKGADSGFIGLPEESKSFIFSLKHFFFIIRSVLVYLNESTLKSFKFNSSFLRGDKCDLSITSIIKQC